MTSDGCREVVLASRSPLVRRAFQRVFEDVLAQPIATTLQAILWSAPRGQVLLLDEGSVGESGRSAHELPDHVLAEWIRRGGSVIRFEVGSHLPHILHMLDKATRRAGAKGPRMIADATSAWHHLKYARDAEVLALLRDYHGQGAEVDEYVRLSKQDTADGGSRGSDYAAAMERSSRDGVVGTAPSAAPSSSDGGDRMGLLRPVSVLVIDDDPSVGEELKDRARFVNARHVDLFVRILAVTTADQAKKTLLTTHGILAVALDRFLEPNSEEPERASVELASWIKQNRPDVLLLGLTGRTPGHPVVTHSTASWGVSRTFFKDDPNEPSELLNAVLTWVRERACTPLFSALDDHAAHPTVVFHALPLSRGKSVVGCPWTKRFADFYGEGYFAAETSATAPPLDSFFRPTGSLLYARTAAARAFHADDTLFNPGGTTLSNSVVYRALCRPGDLVLLDRNCHRSHHHAAVQAQAHVLYLEPEAVPRFGLTSLVRRGRICDVVRKHRGDVRMIALTHPTFDGALYDVERLMREVYEVDDSILFLFDEAWFAYGAFHPRFHNRATTMSVERMRRDGLEPRVYVTQSAHKTLSAMRQASLIHVCDSRRSDQDKIALDVAIEALCSTSPNYHILGSLDVARMQAELYGFDALNRAIGCADWVREQLGGGVTSVVAEEELIPPTLSEEAVVDPLKVTLHSEAFTGTELKQALWNAGIQVNKYSMNSVLLLFTIGTTWSMADYLVRVTEDLQHDGGRDVADAGVALPQFSGFAKKFHGPIAGSGDIGAALAASLRERIDLVPIGAAAGRTAAAFVTPYPPGCPVIVPGQLLDAATLDLLEHLMAMPGAEIHGLRDNTVPVLHDTE